MLTRTFSGGQYSSITVDLPDVQADLFFSVVQSTVASHYSDRGKFTSPVWVIVVTTSTYVALSQTIVYVARAKVLPQIKLASLAQESPR